MGAADLTRSALLADGATPNQPASIRGTQPPFSGASPSIKALLSAKNAFRRQATPFPQPLGFWNGKETSGRMDGISEEEEEESGPQEHLPSSTATQPQSTERQRQSDKQNVESVTEVAANDENSSCAGQAPPNQVADSAHGTASASSKKLSGADSEVQQCQSQESTEGSRSGADSGEVQTYASLPAAAEHAPPAASPSESKASSVNPIKRTSAPTVTWSTSAVKSDIESEFEIGVDENDAVDALQALFDKPETPVLIWVVGAPGSGKTYCCTGVAEALGLVIAGSDLATSAATVAGLQQGTAIDVPILANCIAQHIHLALSAGAGVVLDGWCTHNEFKLLSSAFEKAHGAPLVPSLVLQCSSRSARSVPTKVSTGLQSFEVPVAYELGNSSVINLKATAYADSGVLHDESHFEVDTTDLSADVVAHCVKALQNRIQLAGARLAYRVGEIRNSGEVDDAESPNINPIEVFGEQHEQLWAPQEAQDDEDDESALISINDKTSIFSQFLNERQTALQQEFQATHKTLLWSPFGTFCPVSYAADNKLRPGSAQFAAAWRGYGVMCATEQALQSFLKNPSQFMSARPAVPPSYRILIVGSHPRIGEAISATISQDLNLKQLDLLTLLQNSVRGKPIATLQQGLPLPHEEVQAVLAAATADAGGWCLNVTGCSRDQLLQLVQDADLRPDVAVLCGGQPGDSHLFGRSEYLTDHSLANWEQLVEELSAAWEAVGVSIHSMSQRDSEEIGQLAKRCAFRANPLNLRVGSDTTTVNNFTAREGWCQKYCPVAIVEEDALRPSSGELVVASPNYRYSMSTSAAAEKFQDNPTTFTAIDELQGSGLAPQLKQQRIVLLMPDGFDHAGEFQRQAAALGFEWLDVGAALSAHMAGQRGSSSTSTDDDEADSQDEQSNQLVDACKSILAKQGNASASNVVLFGLPVDPEVVSVLHTFLPSTKSNDAADCFPCWLHWWPDHCNSRTRRSGFQHCFDSRTHVHVRSTS